MDVQWNFAPGGSPFSPSQAGGSSGTGMAAIAEDGVQHDRSGPFGSLSGPSGPAAAPTGPGRRTSVSAESANIDSRANWSPPVFEKSPSQMSRLRDCLGSCGATSVLFARLEAAQRTAVLLALQEKSIPAAGVKIIEQGATGDHFYIVESGHFDVHVHSSGAIGAGVDGLGDKVGTVGPGGSFGELALMYNAPRAATVLSTSPATVWALDRQTFQHILLRAAFERRDMFDSFLQSVELLATLEKHERGKIADVLQTHRFSAGDPIIQQGDIGDKFYLLVSGHASVYKTGEDGKRQLVHQYGRGDYFGELALLNNEPRAATVISQTDVEVASLDKAAFQRLLGPVESIMRRNDPRHRAGHSAVRYSVVNVDSSRQDDDVDPLAS